MAFVANRGITVALKGGVEVRVSVRVQKKVGAVPTGYVRGVVVIDGVGVEKLAGVVGVVASFLEPDWQIGFVEALTDELGVST